MTPSRKVLWVKKGPYFSDTAGIRTTLEGGIRAMNKKTVILIICTALILACHNSNTPLKSKIIHNEKTDVYTEGGIFSIRRWEHVQEKLKSIKKGMDREDVLKILGKPDGLDYTPSNMIQYSLSYKTEGEGWQTISIHVLFDNGHRVREIQSNEFVYGPSTLQ